MSKVRDMIDAIADENFDGARCALKTSLAQYMSGKKYLSNKDVFGTEYADPNEYDQELKASMNEELIKKSEEWLCDECGHEWKTEDDDMPDNCPKCGVSSSSYDGVIMLLGEE